MAVPLDPRSSVHIARQAILGPNRRVFGYELLHRARATDRSCTLDGDLAASRTLTDALLAIGLDTLTAGSRAFVNFTRPLLLHGAAELLPAQSVVVELREDIAVDAEVTAACRALHAAGYALALDDFVGGSGAEALLPFARYVKLDVLDTAPRIWQPLAQRLSSQGLTVVAERVETLAVAAQAQDAGCSLFQGFYFCVPATRSAPALPARRLAYLKLFAEINAPNLTITTLEDLIKRDVSLTMRVLKSINSAAFAVGAQITSLRHALVLLGIQQVRKWASVWSMAGVNAGCTPELVSVALLRARTCEALGDAWFGSQAAGELFLLGMCSLLDAILDQPMEQAISGLQLSAGLRNALLGGSNGMRSILDAVIAYEHGDWDGAGAILRELGLKEQLLSAAYTNALTWARELPAGLEAA